jgi:hypothetical protein
MCRCSSALGSPFIKSDSVVGIILFFCKFPVLPKKVDKKNKNKIIL